ncbi:MAG: hypothetical protein CVT95_12410 [Bacteroidetes bacterium HGW-Bacteroidetes-12]|jgi:hypothetical protein|nr:MAG: hypothetical protein CVT95_12410 [Bacteroidetes bacterium HGW-Bacteroidetes-12]
MFKLVKYGFVYLATIIVLMHSVVPHIHHSIHSAQEHQFMQENETAGFIDLLAVIFHDFTDEGQMEDIIVKSHDDFNFFTPHIDLIHYATYSLTLNELTPILIRSISIYEQHFPVHSGTNSSWGIRPPPFA